MSRIRNTGKNTVYICTISVVLFSRRHTYYQEERVEKGPLLLPTSRGGRPFLAQDRQHASFIHIFLSNSNRETFFISLCSSLNLKENFNFFIGYTPFMIFKSEIFEPIDMQVEQQARYKLDHPSLYLSHPSLYLATLPLSLATHPSN
jgi:hypothetical protein